MDKKDIYIKEKLQEDKSISNKCNEVFKNFKGGEYMEDKEKKVIKISLKSFIAIAASVTIIGTIGVNLYAKSLGEPNLITSIAKLIKNEDAIEKIEKVEEDKTEKILARSEYELVSNNFSKFDFSFLKTENERKNKIYSPLSIKYALKMLEEGTSGEAKEQLDSIANNYTITPYKTNSKMAFANVFFVRDTFADSINENYKSILKSKYNAEIQTSDFSSAKTINNWVNKNTLGLISDIYTDDEVSDLNFALINSLGINMEWKHKFLQYNYEDDKNITRSVGYQHENVYWEAWEMLTTLKFNKNQAVSSMRVIATLNNYDIVKELGEDNIKKTVKEAFIKWINEDKEFYQNNDEYIKEFFEDDFSEEGIDKAFEKYWTEGFYEGNGYISEIETNNKRVDYSTDFSIYVDDNVKVFAKDLEKVDGTTLQYVGIMPKNEDLDKFLENTSEEEVLELIAKLKDLKLGNFKDGVLTEITGYIPKFKFDYELNLKEDLKKIGVIDIFEQGKANLTGLTDNKDAFIDKIKHKANIEFTEDGIKAAATTGAGGAGAGGYFDYIFDIPVEEIDITFDKPYMFLIRDKATGETWFTGTVYNPLDSKEETGSIEFDFMS